jgi:hypothetical protein
MPIPLTSQYCPDMFGVEMAVISASVPTVLPILRATKRLQVDQINVRWGTNGSNAHFIRFFKVNAGQNPTGVTVATQELATAGSAINTSAANHTDQNLAILSNNNVVEEGAMIYAIVCTTGTGTSISLGNTASLADLSIAVRTSTRIA